MQPWRTLFVDAAIWWSKRVVRVESTPRETPAINLAFLQKLRWLGFIEGISTLVLFGIAMPLKYIAGRPLAVHYAGSIHGGLFTCLGLMLLIAIWRIPISWRMAMMGVVAAVVPFGPFVYDRWLAKLAEAS